MLTMEAQVAVIPNRWRGHGVDVCMVLKDDRIRFVAADVLTANGIEPQGEIARDVHRAGMSLQDHGNGILWDRRLIGTVLAETSFMTDPGSGFQSFLAWIDGLIRDVEMLSINRVVSMSTRQVAHVHLIDDTTPAPPVAPAWYSVKDAARILSTDPVLQLTQPALFTVLEQRGWIYRDPSHTWQPQRELLLTGWLTVRDVRIPVDTHLYPQICITPLGLTQLHKFLGGTTPLELTPTGVPA